MTWPLQETWALQVESSSSILPIVKVHNNLFLVYTKLNALSYGYKLSLFGGALSLYMVWCTFWTQLDPPLLKQSTLILTVSHIYLYRIPGTSLGAKFLPLFETTKILVAPPKNDVLQKKCRLPSLNICQRIMVGKKTPFQEQEFLTNMQLLEKRSQQ